jgi:hypothetical protein
MIDFDVLHRSTVYYEDVGFKRIESPWTVTKAVSDITRPEGSKEWPIEGKDKVLVASGEQSFLYLYLKGFLPKGRFQTITPCFRDEPFDLTHTKYFMKNELIVTDAVDLSHLVSVIDLAAYFFQRYLPEDEIEVVWNGDTSADINWKGYELGSYSIRSCPYLDWICGTGVAEPRFSTLVNMYKGIRDELSQTRDP